MLGDVFVVHLGVHCIGRGKLLNLRGVMFM
jgi:hypothetical protein